MLSYLLPLELISTRYMVHYDADMLLYQKEGQFWTLEAIDIMNEYDNAVFGTPRVAPPFTEFLDKEENGDGVDNEPDEEIDMEEEMLL